jgi:GDPmannose 4,6-dehydratase
VGDASKAKELLGWQAQTYTPELVNIMVDADIAKILGGRQGL